MALAFVGGTPSVLYKSQSLISGYSCTMSCWFYPTSQTDYQALVALVPAGGSGFLDLAIQDVGSGKNFMARAYDGGSNYDEAASLSDYVLDTWQFGAGVFTSATNRDCYYNGAAAVNRTLNVPISGLDRLSIGGLNWNTGPLSYFSGSIAEVGIWNTTLTSAEISILALGMSPRFVRPGNLVFYVPLIRDVVDYRHTGTWTNTGTSVDVHPRMFYPFHNQFTKGSTTLSHYTLALDAGIYAITGSALSLKFNRVLALAAGSYSITGSPLSLKYNRVIALAGGAYTLSGSPVSLYYNRSLSLESGSYLITGSDAAPKYNRIMALESGAYTITGQAANILYNRVLHADPGSYVIDGQPLALKSARIFPLGSGSYLITGSSVDLTVSNGTPVSTPPYLLLLGVGS